MKNTIPFLAILSFFGCAQSRDLPTVGQVDLNRYQGRWYEIASFPIRPQRNCTATYAEYTLNKEGYVEVYNHCIDSTDGSVKDISGKAFVETAGDNSRLLVQFFWPFKAPYQIIALDTVDYQYALVGSPSRKYLWILNRQPQMAADVYAELVAKAKALEFPVEKLVLTKHP